MANQTARKLDCIQEEHRLNDVYRMDDAGPGNAHHRYIVSPITHPIVTLATIDFQNGPRNDPASQAGVLDGDLLEIVRDRLRSFQSGPFACDENEQALYHVEAALLALRDRAYARAKRGVLGTYEK